MRLYTEYPIEESKEEGMQRFAVVKNLTEKIAGSNNVNIPCDEGMLKCWKYIASFWKDRQDLMHGIDFMFEAFYYICRRKFSENVREEKVLRLILLIEEELGRCGYAFRAWYEMDDFQKLYYEFYIQEKYNNAKKSYPSYRHNRYVSGKMIQRISYKERSFAQWGDAIDCDRVTYPYDTKYLLDNVKDYEVAIDILLPESTSWYEQWMDVSYITNAIKKRHKVDFTNDAVGYDNLIGAVANSTDVMQCAYYLYRMKTFPLQLAKHIWGADADRMIQRCFLNIYGRYKAAKKNTKRSQYSQQAVMGSWIYQWIAKKYDSKDDSLSHKAKDAYFRVSMGI